MAILFMLGWWYGKGWFWALGQIGLEINKVGKIFAVSNLLKTWFAPWKQITSTLPQQSFFQRLTDNTISRLIGFVIRSFILLFALIWTAIVTIFGILTVLAWPFVPLSIIILPILYFSGVVF